ncbi:MAG: glutathione S-transferase [Alphaproteobacteria bacterium]|nr:glutathione S-transferase [Alphaproteobacteria bacterium]
MIDLYTAATPNGHKISIALEEMALDYRVHAIDLASGSQKQPDFLALNPNGRIPVIIDRDNGGNNGGDNGGDNDGDHDDLTIFESGAILIYLAEKTGMLMPSAVRGRMEVIQWLMFQMSAIGPIQGQAHVFVRYFPEKIQPVIDRYQHETRRLYQVLNRRLENRDYLAGAGCGDYSIADIAHWCWVRSHEWAGVRVDDLSGLTAWLDRIAARPAAQKGINIPAPVDSTETVEAGKTMIVT